MRLLISALLIITPIYLTSNYVLPALDALEDFYRNIDVIAEQAVLSDDRH